MYTLINVLLVNLFEAYNLFLINPIILFVLKRYGIVNDIVESQYYLCLFNSVYAISQFICLNYWDNVSLRIGKRLTMIVGLILIAFSYILFGFSYNIYMLVASRFMLGFNSNVPATRTFLLEKIESDNKSKYILLSTMSWRIGAVLGSFVGGVFYEYEPNIMENTFQNYPLLFLGFISFIISLFLIFINIIIKCCYKPIISIASPISENENANINNNTNTNNTNTNNNIESREPYGNIPIINNIAMEISEERIDYEEDISIWHIFCDKKIIFLVIGSVLFNGTHIAFSDVFRVFLMDKNTNGGYSYDVFYIQLAMFIGNLLSIVFNLIFKLFHKLLSKCECKNNIKIGFTIQSFFAIPFICMIPYTNSIITKNINNDNIISNSTFNLCAISMLYSFIALTEGWGTNKISLMTLKLKNKVLVGTLYGAIQNITNIVQILIYLCLMVINMASIKYNLKYVIDYHTIFYATPIFIIIATIFIKIHNFMEK
jgi:MFS family permease